jgi:DNA-binding transcriptional ArsR family regulator
MSRDLRALKESGFVEESHPDFDARVRIYALKREGVRAVKSWIDETEALWTRQLASFKGRVERRT